MIITTSKLSTTFSNAGTQQHVLKNLDIEIAAGSFTVIMGPSGAGKSTLLYALSGMDRPSLGSVCVAGEEISGYSEDARARFRRRHCGFMFQQIYLLDFLSVIDNVMAVGRLTSDRATIGHRAKALFDIVGLSEADRAKFPPILSGGEASRAALMRALINEPDVLFTDEPTGQLNSEFSNVVLDLLCQVNASGQTIVMVTHDIGCATRGSHVMYLRDGTIRGELDLSDLAPDDRGRHDRATVFLSDMGWSAMRAIGLLIKRDLRRRKGQAAVLLILSLLTAGLINTGYALATSYLANIDAKTRTWHTPDAMTVLSKSDAIADVVGHLRADKRIGRIEVDPGWAGPARIELATPRSPGRWRSSISTGRCNLAPMTLSNAQPSTLPIRSTPR